MTDLSIPLEGGVSLGARFFAAAKQGATILFFHGNGEIVADYDDVGPLFMSMGVNFFAVDYRGYGRSGGSPTVSSLMTDCHEAFEFARTWLANRGFDGPLVVMGRSLGSAPALELASSHGEKIDGLIIESGFARTVPLMEYLGIDTAAWGITEEKGMRNSDKVAAYGGPVLVIHAEHDQIIPFEEGEMLYRLSASADKNLVRIPGADHNTIFVYGLEQYLGAVAALVKKSFSKRP